MTRRITLARAMLGVLASMALTTQTLAAEPNEPSEPVPGIRDDESLSKQLDEDKGVIEPPPVGDAEIHVPAPDPDPGTTPVIPPPGTPGGDESIEPK